MCTDTGCACYSLKSHIRRYNALPLDGYIIKVDYTEQKKLAAAVSRIATNINHVCRRINSTGHFYDADVAELKERMADVWELLKTRQREEL